ncbi:MAG: PEGA domain-containing protein [Myxococcaceae bacterium]|nr:PEGA domain-containing protein [Myxococcaceae bacterium]
MLLFSIACAHAPPAKTVTGLRLEVVPPDAELTIDGQVLGPLSSVPLEGGVLGLSPGVHQLSLKAKGYQTWRGEVALGNDVEPLKVSLVKK